MLAQLLLATQDSVQSLQGMIAKTQDTELVAQLRVVAARGREISDTVTAALRLTVAEGVDTSELEVSVNRYNAAVAGFLAGAAS